MMSDVVQVTGGKCVFLVLLTVNAIIETGAHTMMTDVVQAIGKWAY